MKDCFDADDQLADGDEQQAAYELPQPAFVQQLSNSPAVAEQKEERDRCGVTFSSEPQRPANHVGRNEQALSRFPHRRAIKPSTGLLDCRPCSAAVRAHAVLACRSPRRGRDRRQFR